MEKWSFGIDNNELISLVLAGKKTATSYLYNNENLPTVGERTIIQFDEKRDACVVETVDIQVLKFCEMTKEKAKLEGEGDLSLEYWEKVHLNFFKSINPNFTENDKIVFEQFKVIKIF